MFRGIKVRLYPTKEQTVELNKVLGCYRFVYNHLLSRKQEAYNNDKTNLGLNELSKYFHNTLLKQEEYYPTIYATKEDCHELYTKLSDCDCSVLGYRRVPEDFWNKNKRDNKYHFKIVDVEKKLVNQKNFYLKTFGFDDYKK